MAHLYLLYKVCFVRVQSENVKKSNQLLNLYAIFRSIGSLGNFRGSREQGTSGHVTTSNFTILRSRGIALGFMWESRPDQGFIAVYSFMWVRGACGKNTL